MLNVSLAENVSQSEICHQGSVYGITVYIKVCLHIDHITNIHLDQFNALSENYPVINIAPGKNVCITLYLAVYYLYI